MSATHDVSLESVARIYRSCLPPRPMKHGRAFERGPQVAAPQATEQSGPKQRDRMREAQNMCKACRAERVGKRVWIVAVLAVVLVSIARLL